MELKLFFRELCVESRLARQSGLENLFLCEVQAQMGDSKGVSPLVPSTWPASQKGLGDLN